MKALFILYCIQHRKDFCTSRHKQSSNLLVQFSRVLSTQSCSKTYGLYEARKTMGRESGESLGQSDLLLWGHAFSSALLLITGYRFFCARHEKILPPVFMCAGCVSLECLAVPAHSALKVLVFLSWVAQNNGMMLGISSLLLYSSCPAYQKVWVVYLSIFLSCIALMGKT